MLVWRICSRKHVRHAFDGEGAWLYGGRWNHRYTAMVYTSSTLSLAALELFVNLDRVHRVEDLVAIAATIPMGVSVRVVRTQDLPQTWRRYPAPEELRDLGARWLRRGTSCVLSVPSAIIPRERNFLLNPRHEDFRKISIQQPELFRFDPRMWKAPP